jgi:hypothetical protein
LLPTLKTVLARFAHIKQLIVVADRGLLWLDNVDELRKVMLPNGQALEFIVAVPGAGMANLHKSSRTSKAGLLMPKKKCSTRPSATNCVW